MSFRFEQLVGRYRLVVSNELLAFIERAFVEPAPPTQHDAIRREALEEARGAAVEILPDGTFVSRAGDQEFYRIPLPLDRPEYERLSFEKAPGVGVILEMPDADTILAYQEGKPTAEFRRSK